MVWREFVFFLVYKRETRLGAQVWSFTEATEQEEERNRRVLSTAMVDTNSDSDIIFDTITPPDIAVFDAPVQCGDICCYICCSGFIFVFSILMGVMCLVIFGLLGWIIGVYE